MIDVAAVMFAGFLVWTIFWTPMAVWLNRYMHKYFWDVKKVWAVGLNSNNGLGSVRLVKPDEDALRISGGYEIPTEMNYGFKDTGPLTAGCPIFVYDPDTGGLVRPYAGEVEISDPSGRNSRELDKAMETAKRAGGIDFAKIAVILGAVTILGLIIVGFMMMQLRS